MRGYFIAVVIGCMFPGMAMADNLPWLNQPSASAKAAPVGNAGAMPWNNAAPVMSRSTKASHAEMPAMEGPETREQDDRKLNAMAQDYYAIKPTSKNAVSKLTTLQRRAADFHKVLNGRAYDAHDISTDLGKLEVRIASAKKKALAANQATQSVANTKPTTAQKNADDAAQEALATIKKVDSGK